MSELIFADLHIHSKYSRATSQRMEPETIAENAEIKGLNLIGTGDFTHPKWFKILKDQLVEVEGSGGFFTLRGKRFKVMFVLQTEVSTVFQYEGKVRKVHHVILAPSFDVVTQINDSLRKFGDLEADGRPTFTMSAAELVEELKSISKEVEIFPAHAWTPWFGVFGSISGFNSLEECYQDKVYEIHALETGLSSDPPMNWRVSKLDGITLISASDAHSPNPLRLGREATVFRLKEISYKEIIEAIRNKDPNKLLYTIEVWPAYGKYHFTGHRKCGVVMSPIEALKRGNICPVCGKKLTIGVDQRVEELADRPMSLKPPKNFPAFIYLLPLEEIIEKAVPKIRRRKVMEYYEALVKKAGSEYKVLIDLDIKEISTLTNGEIASAIQAIRLNKVKIKPGYDGVYGEIIFFREKKEEGKRIGTLEDFM